MNPDAIAEQIVANLPFVALLYVGLRRRVDVLTRAVEALHGQVRRNTGKLARLCSLSEPPPDGGPSDPPNGRDDTPLGGFRR